MDLSIATFASELIDRPMQLALLLFAATFVLEDLATIAAAILVSQTRIDPVLPLVALIFGTALGDMALYGLGRWGSVLGFSRKLAARPEVKRAERWMERNAAGALFLARFMPGFRLPIFTASGLLKAPLFTVIAIIAIGTPIWTGILFLTAHQLGSSGASTLLNAAMLAALVALVFVPCISRIQKKRINL